MKFNGSDLADWIDENAEEYWRQQDEFLINAYHLGDAHPVFVFNTWLTNGIGRAPSDLPVKMAVGTLTEVLRIGNDLTFDSASDAAKGVALNVLRLLSVVQPATGYLKNQFRHKGLLALAELTNITGGFKSPCQFTAFNNVVSFLGRHKMQYFADVKDIIGVKGSAKGGIYIKDLLEHPSILQLVGRIGITWRTLPAVRTIDQAIDAAKRSEGMIRFTFKWVDDFGKDSAHAVVAIKDLKGNVRIIDYTQGKTAAVGGMGYASWTEMVAARTSKWGKGLKNATLSVRSDPPTEFSSTYLKVLHLADGTFTLALPVSVGMKWVRNGYNKSFDDAAPDIASAMSGYFEKTLGSKAPPPPESLYPSPTRPPEMTSLMFTHEIKGPRVEKNDWLSSIAARWYGDGLLWPVLFDHNKGLGFTDPNKMKVGLRIKVPFITDKNSTELAAIRTRGRNWR